MVTLLTRSTVLKFSVNCIMQCSANNLCRGSEVTKLHRDNATAHSSQLVQNYVVKHQIPQVLQFPYSPCDFFLFPKEKYAVEED